MRVTGKRALESMKILSGILLAVCFCGFFMTALPLMAETADKAVEIMGDYVGYRDSSIARQLNELQKNYFELVHQGNAEQAKLLKEKKIAPLQKKLEALPDCKLTMFTEGRGLVNLHLLIDPVSASEEKKGGGYTSQVWFDIEIKQFYEIFAGNRQIEKLRVGMNNFRYKTFVSTRIKGDQRKVIVNQIFDENKAVDESHLIEFDFSRGNLTRITVNRNKRPDIAGVSFGSLKNFMKAQISGIRKTAQGIRAGRSGRLVTKRFIEQAVSQPNSNNLYKLVTAEEEFLKNNGSRAVRAHRAEVTPVRSEIEPVFSRSTATTQPFPGQSFSAIGKEWKVWKNNVKWTETSSWIKGLGNGWRTPRISELKKLQKARKGINAYFWAEEDPGDPEFARIFNFFLGRQERHFRSRYKEKLLWGVAVR